MRIDRRTPRQAAVALTAMLALAACDVADVNLGPEEESNVAIRFTAAQPASQALAPGVSAARIAADDELAITGTNGTLLLTDVRLIVSEFELERADGDDDCDSSGSGNPCDEDGDADEVELDPYFLDLPLAGEPAVAAAGQIEPGTYEEIEFEVEDLEVDDDDDSRKSQQIEALLAEIRGEFADWPDSASMLVTGTFTPADGEPAAFRVYVEAEIEVELEFEPPLTLGEDDVNRAITVHVDPAALFTRPDGSVLDLSAFDFDATGEVFEFEAEFEFDHGFQVEHDDD